MKAGTVRLGVLVDDLHGGQRVNYERPGSRWLAVMHLRNRQRLPASVEVGDRLRLTWTGTHWKCEVLGRAWPKPDMTPVRQW